MKTNKRLTLTALTVLALFSGLAPGGMTAPAGSDTLVTLCFRNRTIQVPSYLVGRYVAMGATAGPCL